jgi:hypothetical protein
MRKELIAAGFAGMLATACVTSGGTPLTPAQYVTLACGYQVLANELAALLAANPAIGTLEAAGAIICQTAAPAVTPVAPVPLGVTPVVVAKSARRGTATVRISGVTLHLKRT